MRHPRAGLRGHRPAPKRQKRPKEAKQREVRHPRAGLRGHHRAQNGKAWHNQPKEAKRQATATTANCTARSAKNTHHTTTQLNTNTTQTQHRVKLFVRPFFPYCSLLPFCALVHFSILVVSAGAPCIPVAFSPQHGVCDRIRRQQGRPK